MEGYLKIKLGWKRLMKKCKNVPQMPQMWYICTTKVWHLYHKSVAVYYINVPHFVGGEKKYHIVALVWEKAEFRGHSSCIELREK